MTLIDLQRIKDLEYKYSEVTRVMAALDMALDEYTDIKSYIGDLKDYMESGILNEDGLYDLLESVDRILGRARGI